MDDVKQLLRSSGSIAANYIETNEAIGTKDFRMKARICRKEAKESVLWLDLLDQSLPPELEQERQKLFREAGELKLIFNAIVRKISEKISDN